MKKLILFLGVVVSLVAARTTFAQGQEGVITYEVRVNNHRNLPAGMEGRKAMIPEFTTYKEQLFFTAGESICKPLIEEEEEEDGGGGPGRGNRRRFQPRTQYYTNQSTTLTVTQENMMGKSYLINDTVKVSPWKFGTELKPVAGYTCKQAFYTDATGKIVTAWYTDKLRPFLGPDRYNSLPGAVLAIDVNNGDRVLVALKIELRAVKPAEVAAPSSGDKMTQAEYDKMREERMKNFRQGPGGGGPPRN